MTIEQSPEFDAIRMKIAELEQSLLANDPGMSQYLKRIHANLLQQPELVHILRDEERATIIQAASRLTGEIINAAAKKSTAKKLAAMTADDI